MKTYKKEFIEFALANDVLRFGDFTLKSGRKSAYFFNAGMFKTGEAFERLGHFYATALNEHFSKDEYSLLFGPAYKGIILATTTSIALSREFKTNMPVSYNRKEAKDHGEGGVIVGESLKDKNIILIDDVITAGTTVRDSVDIIQKEGGKLVGVLIALDRQEKGLSSDLTAIQEVEKNYAVKVANIISLQDLIQYLQTSELGQKPEMQSYLEQMQAVLT